MSNTDRLEYLGGEKRRKTREHLPRQIGSDLQTPVAGSSDILVQRMKQYIIMEKWACYRGMF